MLLKLIFGKYPGAASASKTAQDDSAPGFGPLSGRRSWFNLMAPLLNVSVHLRAQVNAHLYPASARFRGYIIRTCRR
jgi:hypothetical protein